MIDEIAKWVLIIIGGIIGSTILYIIGWQILASVAPDAVEKYNLYFIVKDIKKYFGFLFDKGYTIRNKHFSYQQFGNWYVILESSKYFIRIDCDRSYISILFDPEKANGRHYISLEALIYYLSKGKYFVGYFESNPTWGKSKQLERLSGLLSEYHNQIATLFKTDFQRLKEDLAPS